MRSIWKGVISFGLVNIPVRLYRAVEERSVHFRQLHGRCGTPIRYRRWCPRCDVEVPVGDIVRGYEYSPDQFVLIDDVDLANLPLPTAKAVEILDFVRAGEIDPIYFERTYYLEPVDGGTKAYGLLRQAMDLRGCVAVAKVALRNKETLACLRTYRSRVLALVAMAYPDEIRPIEALPAFVAAAGNGAGQDDPGDGRAPLAPPTADPGSAGQDGQPGNGRPAASGSFAAGLPAAENGGTAPPGAGAGPAPPSAAVQPGWAGSVSISRELELALHLIDRLTVPFDPARYRDRYREALEAVVRRKLEGRREVVVAPEPAPVIDLMEALRASLQQVEGRARSPAATR